MKEKMKRFLIWFIALGGLVGLDQGVKLLTIQHLKGKPSISLIPGVFELTYVENRGAAFGMLQDQRWLLLSLTAVVVMILMIVYFRLGTEKRFRITRMCALVVSAGAIGNWIDRVFRHYVVDTFYFSLIDFPVFNVADCYVVVCGILFCVAAIFQKNLLDELAEKLKR